MYVCKRSIWLNSTLTKLSHRIKNTTIIMRWTAERCTEYSTYAAEYRVNVAWHFRNMDSAWIPQQSRGRYRALKKSNFLVTWLNLLDNWRSCRKNCEWRGRWYKVALKLQKHCEWSGRWYKVALELQKHNILVYTHSFLHGGRYVESGHALINKIFKNKSKTSWTPYMNNFGSIWLGH